jgi:hypothetical protein
MSDAQNPGQPGTRIRPAGGPPPAAKAPRPARPALQPPAPSAGSMAMRKFLMLGIIVACVGLSGAIGWRLWQRMHPRESAAIDVGDAFEKAKDIGKGASKDIFAVQTKVWSKDAELTAEDFTTIKAKLAELRECHDKLKDLLDLLHDRHKEDTDEFVHIVPYWLQVKMWILDATDLLENQKPPEYGGLNIPMFVTSKKLQKSQDELKEINTTKDDVIKRNDPEEIKKTRKRISDLRESFKGHVAKFQELDKYVTEGLARPDLTIKEVVELEQLRDDANKAQMAVKAAGTLLQAFPE